MTRALIGLLTWLCLTTPCWATTLFLRDDATNWTTSTSWSTISALSHTGAAVPTAADTCIAELASGNVTISAASTCGSFSTTAGTGSWGGTITHNAFIWTVAGNITFNSGMTYTPLATSTVTLSGTNTLTTAGKLFPLLILNTGITTTLGDNLSFMASNVITLTLNGNSLDLNGKTVSGNSATKRLLIRSDTIGTARTITISSGTFANADFRDITASTSTDISAITGNSGDCGGNTSFTFTTAATQYWFKDTGSWSTAALWFLGTGGTGGAGRVPLPQDNVVFDGGSFSAGSKTVTMDMPRAGNSINWSGATQSPTWNFNQVNGTIYGSLTLISGMTMTFSQNPIFEGRGAFTLTTGGKTMGGTINMINGSLTQQDSCLWGTLSLSNGTFSTGNNFSLTITGIIGTNNTNTRALTWNESLVTFSGTGSMFSLTSTTGLTLSAANATVALTDTSASSKTFPSTSGSWTTPLAALTITGGGTGAVLLPKTMTLGALTIGEPKTVTLTSGVTLTITSLTANGSSGNVITLNSSSAGSAATLSDTLGENICAFCSIKDSTATGGARFVATHSTNVSGNTGWLFQATQPFLMVN